MTDYALLNAQISALSEGCSKPLPMLANAAALLWTSLPDINWAGFYLLSGEELLLGPFQGKIACTRIRLGRGVCGTAAASRCPQRVEDVHSFPGHIACDEASRSELVIPLVTNDGILRGVLDLDSPRVARFTAADEAGLTAFTKALLDSIDWSDGLI
ncbi:MAG: GAF domain-containing protein [Clostridia bacterium]|nr:GAF domain-containing protein [Clostridia bacterium]